MTDEERGTKPEDSLLGQPRSQDGSHVGDKSGHIFYMYSKIAEKDDNEIAEQWQKDADGMLIFAGLFSAAVATFLSMSIPDLRPNSQGPIPRYAVPVNLLWVLSLYTSLSCAVMGTILQQWARRYVKFTQPPGRNPRRRARTRALFAGSADKLFIKTQSLLLPCYLHVSVVLFFIGLLVFFYYLNTIIFILTASFFVFCAVVYSFFTVLPLFQSDSLLYTPISAFPASLLALAASLFHTMFADRFMLRNWSVFDWLFEDVGDRVENVSKKWLPEIDTRILKLTLYSLSDDDAMEEFFGAIPDFLKLHSTNLPPKQQDVFKKSLYDFLDHTFRSTSVAESVQISRLITCLDASRAALGSNGPSWILSNILNGKWPALLRSVEMGHSLRSWAFSNDEDNVLYIRSIVSHIVAENQNDRWVALAADHSDPTPHNFDEAVEGVSLAIHPSIQSAPHHGPILVSGTRPIDISAHHTTRDPADELSFGTVSAAPQPRPQPYTSAISSSLLGKPVPTFPPLPPRPPPPPAPLNVVTVDAGQGNTAISVMANLDPHLISIGGVASQQSESVIPPSNVNDAISVVLPPFADPAVTRSSYPLRA